MGVLDFSEEFFRTTFRRTFFLRGGIIKVWEACVETRTLSVYTYFSSHFLDDSLLGGISVDAEWFDDDDLVAVDRRRLDSVETKKRQLNTVGW